MDILSKAFNNITDDIELDNLIDKLTKKFNNKITTDNHIELYNTFINKYDKQSNKITNNNSVINKKKDKFINKLNKIIATNKPSTTKCFTCNKTGHYASECATMNFMDTYNLFQQYNLNIYEISKKLNISNITTESHLIEAYKRKLELDVDKLGFNDKVYDTIYKKIVELNNPTKLKPIKNELPNYSYMQIKLTLAKMNMH